MLLSRRNWPSRNIWLASALTKREKSNAIWKTKREGWLSSRKRSSYRPTFSASSQENTSNWNYKPRNNTRIFRCLSIASSRFTSIWRTWLPSYSRSQSSQWDFSKLFSIILFRSTNTIRFSPMSINGEQWRMPEWLPSTTFTSSRKKSLRKGCSPLQIRFLMSLLITGSET